MWSCCSEVSGGNVLTMARMCSANTAARSEVAGSLMLGCTVALVRSGRAASARVAAMRVSRWRRYPVLWRLVGRAQRSFASWWC